MLRYKDTLVAKGSNLFEALQKNQNDPDNAKAAKKIYEETYERYKKLHNDEDRQWLALASRRNFNKLPVEVLELAL